MKENLVSETSIKIAAPPHRVWRALVDPALIKEYLFGTKAVSDWKKGSSISYSGTWQGKPYKDKGEIIEIIPEQLLHTTYLSSMSGKEDKPENYNNVIYRLKAEGADTIVSISQDNISSQEELKHMQENWGAVLEGMKKVLER